MFAFRIKSHDFKEKGFVFEMPKLLSLSDCAFRVLFTKFDHYSAYCKSHKPRLRAKETPLVKEGWCRILKSFSKGIIH